MPSENVEKAAAFYPTDPIDLVPLVSREDAAEVLGSRFRDLFDPEFETLTPESAMLPSRVGMRGFVAGWRDWLDPWESWSVAAEDFVESGDKVLVLLDIVARSRTDQVEVPQRAANVLTFEDGRVIRVDLYLDRALAWRAIGLDPEARGEAGRS